MVPCPRSPLAGQCSFGQNTLCGSMLPALLTVGNSHGSLEFASGTRVLSALLLHAQVGWCRAAHVRVYNGNTPPALERIGGQASVSM